MFSRLLSWVKKPAKETNTQEPLKLKPLILERSKHGLSRSVISKQALKVLYRLHDAGFESYLVGGGVRDALLQHHPKDFDVATNARPEEISDLFRNSRMIGRRFRLVHVHFGSHIVEVATFRAGHETFFGQDPNLARSREDGMILRDNIYGTLEQDVFRRDFTINAIYYNIADFSLIDYVNGLEDLKAKTIRIIGDPWQRFREDPLRMLRAIRFAAKLEFSIEPKTKQAILELYPLLSNVPSARLFDEFLKMFLGGFAYSSFKLLREYNLFQILFPALDQILNESESDQNRTVKLFIENALKNTDQRVADEKSVTPIFLLSTFLWYPLQIYLESLILNKRIGMFMALHEASEHILKEQQKCFAIPRKMTHLVKEIWILQTRLQRRQSARVKDVFRHPRFRAAFDFLVLRKEAQEDQLEEVIQWWSNFIAADEPARLDMLKMLGKKKTRHRRHRKKKDFQEKT